MTVLYFAWVKDKIGKSSETFALPGDVTTVGELAGWLAQQSAAHASAFAEPRLVRAAVNQDHADSDHPVADGDEVAFFPPVTGG